MITRALYTIAWTNDQIAGALNTLAGAGDHIRFAYFYLDRVVMTARPLKDTRGVISMITKDEVITDNYADVINRIHQEIYAALIRAAAAMNEEMPAGAD